MLFECFLCQIIDEDDLHIARDDIVETVDFLADRHLVEDSLVDDEVDDEDQKVGNFYFLICMMSYFNSGKSTSNK